MEKKRKLVPPVYFLASLLLMAVLHRQLPLARLVRPSLQWLGLLPLAAGFALVTDAFFGFMKARTPVVPFERSTALVTRGVYRLTRNPMYLGMIVMLIGVALLFGTAGPWLPIPAFAALIQLHFVLGEERFLEDIFGQPYRDYKSRVRRWL